MEEHRPKKLLEQARDGIRTKHDGYRAERAYVVWIKRQLGPTSLQLTQAVQSAGTQTYRVVPPTLNG